MTRYFFHLQDPDECRDEEGTELPDRQVAMARAIEHARDILASDVKAGELCLSHRIDVTSDGNDAIFSVAFRDVVAIRP